MTAASEAAPTYRVRSPFINCKVPGGILTGAFGHRGNWTVMGYYEGAVLPPGVDPADIERLLAGGHIEAVEAVAD